MQSCVVQRRRGLDVGDDVGDGGRSGGDHGAGSRRGIRPPIQTPLVHRLERMRPFLEARVAPLPHLGHAGVLQVRVRVDETGGEHARPVHLVEGDSAGVQLAQHPSAVAHVTDAPRGHRDRAVADRRGGDGQHDGCREHHHTPGSLLHGASLGRRCVGHVSCAARPVAEPAPGG